MIRSLQRPIVRSLVRPLIRHVGTARVVTGNAYPGETLTSTEAGQWFANDVEIAGQTGATYVVALADIGKVIRCADSNGKTITNSPVIAAFVTASGATATAGLSAIELYLRQQNLSAAARVYPLKSAQNAGTGSTGYGFGGLTSDNMTLVNGPTWGADSMTFALASSQYGSIPDFYDAETITTFIRANITTGSSDRVIIGQRQSTPDARSVWLATNNTNISVLNRTSTGNFTSGQEIYTNADTATGTMRTFVSQWVSGGGRSLWWDKTSKALTLSSGSAQTAQANVSSLVTIMAGINSGAPTFPTSGTVIAAMFVRGALTDAQRETLTDLVNAL
jgi:hypothetical protein